MMKSSSDSNASTLQNSATPKLQLFSRDSKIFDRPHTNYMLRLMTAFEVLRSGYRWIKKSEGDESPAQRSEDLVAVLAVCGWIHETVKLIEQGRKGRPGENPPIYKGMVENDERLCQLWDEMKQKSSRRLKSVRRIRNEHIFHFGARGPKSICNLVRKTESDRIPMVESDGTSGLLETMYPPAYVCLGSAFIDGEIDIDNPALIRQEIRETISLITDLMSLVQALLGGVWTDVGLKLVPLEEEQEAK